MKKILVASTNPVKINATLLGFKKMFPGERLKAEGIAVGSQVSDQPMTDEETLQGARNRASKAKQLHTNFDYWVGIEGGIDLFEGDMVTFAWIVILSKDRRGEAKTASLLLADKVEALIKQGKELGDADDIVFERKNSKMLNGTVGILTNDAVTRTTYYRDTIILALIPFKHPHLYQKEKLKIWLSPRIVILASVARPGSSSIQGKILDKPEWQ